jgi:hypothetical protein
VILLSHSRISTVIVLHKFLFIFYYIGAKVLTEIRIQGCQSVEPEPRFHRGSTGDIQYSVKPVPTCSKIKVRPNRISLELRYVRLDRSGPLDQTDIYHRQLLKEKCYGRSDVQHPIKRVPVTFQLLLGGIVDTSTCCESLC